MKRTIKAIIAVAIASCLAQPAFADDQIRDSSSAANSFHATVKSAKGVVLRVPVNAQGQENTSAVVMRLYDGETRATANDAKIEQIWNAGKSIGNVPEVSEQAIQDGATWGWNRYNYNTGWNYGYNYYNYRPYGYYYGNYYNYSYNNYTPYYYTNYYGNYGYRYYYYGCY